MNSRISISIHAPREGGDGLCGQSSKVLQDFNPRPPRGGRRHATRTVEHHGHFNPRPPRGGRPRHVEIVRHRLQYFNPRPPRGGRLAARDLHRGGRTFQSMPPARGATSSPAMAITEAIISIHAPREGGDVVVLHGIVGGDDFNPRPPRGGRHHRHQCVLFRTGAFQSTPPARGATGKVVFNEVHAFISIHAPREGGDFSVRYRLTPDTYFNPRPPRGGRRPSVWKRSAE